MKAIRIRLAWLRFGFARAKVRRYPADAHILPRMENNYICFPDWAHRNDVTFRVCAWVGELLNGGRYCFTVDRNKHPELWD